MTGKAGSRRSEIKAIDAERATIRASFAQFIHETSKTALMRRKMRHFIRCSARQINTSRPLKPMARISEPPIATVGQRAVPLDSSRDQEESHQEHHVAADALLSVHGVRLPRKKFDRSAEAGIRGPQTERRRMSTPGSPLPHRYAGFATRENEPATCARAILTMFAQMTRRRKDHSALPGSIDGVRCGART